jgi:O-antigen ligase
VTAPASTPAAQSVAVAARTRGRFGTVALWVVAAVLFAGPTVIAFHDGGTEARSVAAMAVLAFGLLGALAVFGSWPVVESWWPLLGVAALGLLAAWTGASIAWARASQQAVDDADRVVAYLAVFALAAALMRRPRVRRLAPDALLAGTVVVALYALAGRLLPDLVDETLVKQAGDRLHQPLGYWNALGALMGFGLVLAVAVAGNESRALWWRAGACAAAMPCGLACVLTFSRGAWIATIAGLVTVVATRARRGSAIAAALALVGTVGLGLALRAAPAVLSLDGGQSRQASQGRLVALLALAVAGAVAFAFARLARTRGAGRPLPRAIRRVTAMAIVPLALGFGALVAFNVEQAPHLSDSASRVTTLKTYRGDYWRVALGSFADHPVAGVGTGSFHVEWWRERHSDQFAFDAHSLYLETLAELGAVGGLLLGGFIVTVVLGLRRRWRALPDDPLLAAAAGVLAAFAVHAGLDWDWEMPAVTLVALILAAAALQRPAPGEDGFSPPPEPGTA